MKIVLAGSMIFLEKMKAVETSLLSRGHEVRCPSFTVEELETGADTFMDYVESRGGLEKVLPEDPLWKIKEKAIFDYKAHMDWADAILVCNFDKGDKKNRIGDNTFLEMGYMFFMKKKVYLLQGPPYGDDKIEEVLGMRPTFLDGDISKI